MSLRFASEQLAGRENNKISCRKTEPARKRSLHEINPLKRACHDFAESLDLAFGLKINDDPGIVRAPLLQTLDELRAFGLRQHEIARAKLSDLTIYKCAREILDFATDVILSECRRRGSSRRIPRRCLLILRRD